MLRFKTVYILFFLIICFACNRQDHPHSSQNNSTSSDPKYIESPKVNPTKIGTIVAEIDKNIWNIFQDRSNNYWFGSKAKGVFKYDGKTIFNFTQKDGLVNNRIRGIQEDKNGNIYFDTGSGISKYDGKKFETLELSNAPKDDWKLTQEDLWFEGDWNKNGVFRYDGEYLHHLKFPKHPLEDEANQVNPGASFSPYEVYEISKDSKGNIWMGTSVFGACRFDGDALFWVSEREMTEIDPGPAAGVRSIVEDQDGYFWFSSNVNHKYKIVENNALSQDGESRYEKIKGIETDRIKGLTNYFVAMTEDDQGNIWLARYGGDVWKYDGNQLNQISVGEKSISILTIYKDNHSGILLGTENDGIYKYNGERFIKFL